MASAASIARNADYDLVVIWQPDHHCNARLSDLLDYPGPMIEDATAELCRRRAAKVYNYMEIEEGAQLGEPILDFDRESDIAGRDVYVRASDLLVSPHRDHDGEQDFLRSLIPAAPIRALLARVPHPNPLAVHIRMGTGPAFDHLSYESPENWPAERHAELTQWREKSHMSRFMARIDQLIEEGRAETLFLAADLPETYAAFADRYGNRVRFLARTRFDRSSEQLQYALADLMLLSAADRFLASTWSTFSELAQRLARPGRIQERSGIDF